MYLFIYKTVHKNGRYYIGRHQTNNLKDGYLGSGKWVSGIKDKSTLSREIIDEANSFAELKKLEEYYIALHWSDPLCMNRKRASVGYTSEDSKNLQERKVAEGNHPWMRRADGTNLQTDRVRDGTHPWMRRADGSSGTQDRVRDGTHPWMRRADGSSLAQERVKDGTHNFLQNKSSVPCYNKQGEYKRIPKEQFHSQSGPIEGWEWVHNLSKEGKKRKNSK